MPYSPRIQTWNPAELITTFGKTLSGFADDLITAELLSNTVEMEAGAAGEVVRWLTNDRRGRMTIRLMPSAEDNLYLTGLFASDQASGNIILPFKSEDGKGRDKVFAPTAWIAKPPAIKWRKGIEAREWTFETNDLLIFAGGSVQVVG